MEERIDYAYDLSPHKNGWWFYCSACGFGFDDYYYNDKGMEPAKRDSSWNPINFCPYCGKKIKREESE